MRNIIIPLLLIIFTLPGCISIGSKTPGNFPDFETLSAWVKDHQQPFERGSGVESWYKAALAVQRQAVQDGYLVSAVLTANPNSAGEYLVWCTALVDGTLYWWRPESTECRIFFTKDRFKQETK